MKLLSWLECTGLFYELPCLFPLVHFSRSCKALLLASDFLSIFMQTWKRGQQRRKMLAALDTATKMRISPLERRTRSRDPFSQK